MSDLPPTAILPTSPPAGLTRAERITLSVAERAPIATIAMAMRKGRTDGDVIKNLMREFQCDAATALSYMTDPDAQAMLQAEIRSLRLLRGAHIEAVALERAGGTMARAFDALDDALGSEASEESNERIKQVAGLIGVLGYTPDTSLPSDAPAPTPQNQINIQMNNTPQQTVAPWKERSIRARDGLPQMSSDGTIPKIIDGDSTDNK